MGGGDAKFDVQYIEQKSDRGPSLYSNPLGGEIWEQEPLTKVPIRGLVASSTRVFARCRDHERARVGGLPVVDLGLRPFPDQRFIAVRCNLDHRATDVLLRLTQREHGTNRFG